MPKSLSDSAETPLPLHLHTVESVCHELISGRAIASGAEDEPYLLQKESARAILAWYLNNRSKWSGNVSAADAEAVVDASKSDAPVSKAAENSTRAKGRLLTLKRLEAHRFGGLHAFTDRGHAPENFVFEPVKPITLFEGWNGAGKTSVLNAIIWCLTGQLLRPQRKPEETDEEFACRMKLDATSAVGEYKTTPVSPLPDTRYAPDLSKGRVPLDTWVELTFSDENGTLLSPIRRTQKRTTKGSVEEIPADIASLGIDPISAKIGTSIPGLLPFIQIGSVSEFGQAIAQITGLSDLVDLARHARRAQERISKEFTKARSEEIQNYNSAFQQARNDLQGVLDETPTLKPEINLPNHTDAGKIEEQLTALEQHFISCKTEALDAAKQVLGATFDPADKEARDNLEGSVTPALQQLSDFRKLPSSARLVNLGSLTDDDLANAEQIIAEVLVESRTLAELAVTPNIAKRRQLYARVADWMKQHGDDDISVCKVCGGDLEGALDAITGKQVHAELKDALAGDAELIGHTVTSWATSRIGKLSKELPESLAVELKRDMPPSPVDLLNAAVSSELFETEPFTNTLSVLQPSAVALAKISFSTLPQFVPPTRFECSPEIAEAAQKLVVVVSRVRHALSFARWQKANKDAVNAAVMAVITKKGDGNLAVTDKSPLGIKLVALAEIVKSAAPTNMAIEYCARMQSSLKQRREKERRIEEYRNASDALADVVAIGELAQAQVEGLRATLDGRAAYWRDRIYNNAYSTSGYELVGSGMDARGALTLFVGSNGVSAPAQHVSNASSLRASLVGFYIAFWEHVYKTRGGLNILLLDDPQELLDDDNRDRLARTLPDIEGVGAQLIVTTHSRTFARMSVAEARKRDLIEHRSIHPVNEMRATAKTAPAIEELDQKRETFERFIDDAAKAQDYIVEARVFIEERLADLFDDPAYPAFSTPSKAPTFADYLGRLRGLVARPPNELFRKKMIVDFCNDVALRDGAACLSLLNKAHHRDKSKISYKDVVDEAGNLKRLRWRIEEVHEEFRRWKWRDAGVSAGGTVVLKSARFPAFRVDVHPDLAAFTGEPSKGETQDQAGEAFESSWFNGKSFFYLKNENMGFAAPASSIVVVESEPKPGNDRNLVIALYRNETLARRLLRPERDAVALALAAQTPDPRKSPPTRLLDPVEVQIHRVLGVIFDDLPPPVGKREAVQIDEAPVLDNVVTAYRVRDESALPLALPGQIVLGATAVLPSDLDAYEGRFVALTLTDGASIFKRVGPALPGLRALRKFESIGGLGASEVIVTEPVDGQFKSLPTMQYARLVVGVIYE